MAFLKDKLLWDRYLKSDPDPSKAGAIYLRSIISFAVDVAVLALIFLLRGRLPFHWVACIVAAAMILSVLGPYLAARRKPE